MRKVLSVILALTLVICAWGCSPQPPQNPSDEQTVYYNVTFKQDGYDDVVKRVESGKGLSEENIPVPHDKTGYTVVWEEVDLSCITADIVVYAVETVNEYTIYLLYYPPQSQKETIEQTMPTQIKVKYGEIPVLPEYEKDGYVICGWLNSDDTLYTPTEYLKAENTTLEAKWEYWT